MSHTVEKQPARSRAGVQKGAAAFGVVFLLVGVLGFVPGITTGYSGMRFAGGSTAQLFGYFEVSVLHNAVHLLFGVAGLVLARTAPRARRYLLWGGAVYAVLFFYGVAIEYQSNLNFVPVDDADNFLHLTLAVAMVTLSFVLDPGPEGRRGFRRRRVAS